MTFGHCGNYGLVTFTEEILNGKLYFMCSEVSFWQPNNLDSFTDYNLQAIMKKHNPDEEILDLNYSNFIDLQLILLTYNYGKTINI